MTQVNSLYPKDSSSSTSSTDSHGSAVNEAGAKVARKVEKQTRKGKTSAASKSTESKNSQMAVENDTINSSSPVTVIEDTTTNISPTRIEYINVVHTRQSANPNGNADPDTNAELHVSDIEDEPIQPTAADDLLTLQSWLAGPDGRITTNIATLNALLQQSRADNNRTPSHLSLESSHRSLDYAALLKRFKDFRSYRSTQVMSREGTLRGYLTDFKKVLGQDQYSVPDAYEALKTKVKGSIRDELCQISIDNLSFDELCEELLSQLVTPKVCADIAEQLNTFEAQPKKPLLGYFNTLLRKIKMAQEINPAILIPNGLTLLNLLGRQCEVDPVIRPLVQKNQQLSCLTLIPTLIKEVKDKLGEDYQLVSNNSGRADKRRGNPTSGSHKKPRRDPQTSANVPPNRRKCHFCQTVHDGDIGTGRCYKDPNSPNFGILPARRQSNSYRGGNQRGRGGRNQPPRDASINKVGVTSTLSPPTLPSHSIITYGDFSQTAETAPAAPLPVTPLTFRQISPLIHPPRKMIKDRDINDPNWAVRDLKNWEARPVVGAPQFHHHQQVWKFIKGYFDETICPKEITHYELQGFFVTHFVMMFQSSTKEITWLTSPPTHETMLDTSQNQRLPAIGAILPYHEIHEELVEMKKKGGKASLRLWLEVQCRKWLDELSDSLRPSSDLMLGASFKICPGLCPRTADRNHIADLRQIFHSVIVSHVQADLLPSKYTPARFHSLVNTF